MISPSKSPNTLKQKLIPLLLMVAVVVAFFYFDLNSIISFENLIKNYSKINAFIDSNFAFSLMLFGLVYFTSTLFSLPLGLIMTISGGILFGIIPAVIAIVISASLGSLSLFLAARYILFDFFKKKCGHLLDKLSTGFNDNALNYMLFLRMAPIFPFWLVNIAPAFFNIKTKIYFIATFFGIIPGTAAYVAIGNGLGAVIRNKSIDYSTCISQKAPEICPLEFNITDFVTKDSFYALFALAFVALLPIIYKKISERKKNA